MSRLKITNTTNIRKYITGSVLAASLYSTSLLAINGVYDYGYGQINRGMGGAGIAKPEEAHATIINPAGLGEIKHNLDAGLAIYFPMMYSEFGPGTTSAAPPFAPLAAAQGRFTSVEKVFVMPDISYVKHIDQKNHIGFSLNSIGGFGTVYSTDRTATVSVPAGATTTPRGVFGDGTVISSLKIGSLNGSYNYYFRPNLSLGITLSYYVQAFESAGSQGLAAFTKTFLASGGATTPQELSNNGVDYNRGVGATVGGLYKFNNKISVGFAATPTVRMSRLKKYRDLMANNGELDIPARYALGVNIKPTDKLDLVLDVVRIMNTEVDTYGHNSRALFDGRCSLGSGVTTPNSCLGGNSGVGFGWNNQTVLKAGAEYDINNKNTVRLGFSYGNKIADSKNILVATLAPGAVAEWVLSAGYSRQMNSYKLNTFFTYIPSQTLDGVNELSVGNGQTVKTKIGGLGFGFGVSV